MIVDIGGVPSEKQKLAMLDQHRHILYGGARGGGKSWLVRAKTILLSYYYPGIKIKIIRRTYPELQENHIEPLCDLLRVGTKDAAAKYNKSEKLMTFPNGSKIRFGYCNNDSDIRIYQGMESDIVFIDEATQFPEDWIKAIAASVRGTNGFPKKIYYTCNPGGIGHAYIKRVFVDRDFLPAEHPEDYSFIQAKVSDNAVLMENDPEYIRMLESQPEARRKAWMDGDWDSFEGCVFSEWRRNPDGYRSRRWTHVIDDFPIDDSYKIIRGFDFGYSKPFATIWAAIDHYGRMYIIREFYGCTRTHDTGVEMEPREIARKIKEIETSDPQLKGKRITGIADPAIWQCTTGESIADMMEKEGVYFSKGDNARLSGLMQCHYRLAMDEDGFPMCYVFSSCKHFIRTVPVLVYDDKKIEDVDTAMEDHIYDAWRYICADAPINPRQNHRWTQPEDDPLDIWRK